MKTAVVFLLFLLPIVAVGDTITACIPNDTTFNSLPVAGCATFIPGTDRLTIDLVNLQANPLSVAQGINGLGFVLPGGLAATGILSSSAEAIDVADSGAYASQGTITAGWALDGSGSMIGALLSGGAGPEQLLLGGPGAGGTYNAANGSIAGNGPHNPFLTGTAEFVLDVPGMTPDTEVLDSTFYMGTQPGQGIPVSATPEPSTIILGLTGGIVFFGAGVIRRCLLRRKLE